MKLIDRRLRYFNGVVSLAAIELLYAYRLKSMRMLLTHNTLQLKHCCTCVQKIRHGGVYQEDITKPSGVLTPEYCIFNVALIFGSVFRKAMYRLYILYIDIRSAP